MKIKCDVCEKEEASVFCSADEAALCGGCDLQVHHANKLAGKHPRFSLLHSSIKDSPRCDICQDKRAFLFCKEDRAILCRECDISIHKANEHSQKHNRFLLTGFELSASSSLYSSSSLSSNGSSSNAGNNETETEVKSSVVATARPNEVDDNGGVSLSQEGASMATSSMSEYLMETLPGWHIEDFLDPSSSSPYYGFYSS